MENKNLNITIAGGGVLGSQIAFQTAFKGFNVQLYDINDDALDKAKVRIKNLRTAYKNDLNITDHAFDEGYNRITFNKNISQAVADADFVIEAIPELIDLKVNFYKELGKIAPRKTIFLTNSSTLLPSQFAESTGRPEKFLALHFANEIWKNNTAEVMKHPGTDENIFNEVIELAKSIGMVPLPLHKEQPGYILNSLLVPLLDAAQMLLINGISDVETIDKTWMIGTGAPQGPFAILDIIGINTAYNIVLAKAEKTGNQQFKDLALLLKTEYIDKGKLGRETGEGFYQYPNPSYMKAGFLEV